MRHSGTGLGVKVVICLPPQGTPPPTHTAADMAHSTYNTQPAMRPHCATPRAEDKPPQMRSNLLVRVLLELTFTRDSLVNFGIGH